MRGLFAGLATLDLGHLLDEVPDPLTKTTSRDHFLAAGGPASNAAVTFATLSRAQGRRGAERATHPAYSGRVSPDGAGESGATLLTAVGRGDLTDILVGNLMGTGVTVLDATAPGQGSVDPALSGIVEHPAGRMVTSTNARLAVDVGAAGRLLSEGLADEGGPDVVLVDGHNPELAALALRVGTSRDPRWEAGGGGGARRGRPGVAGRPAGGGTPRGNGRDEDAHPGTLFDEDLPEDPFAELEEHPSHLRLLDGGSWKPWLAPLLGQVDVAVVSADFHPPFLTGSGGDAVADFLRGFGITRVVRTDGANPVHWWWDDEEGEVGVDAVPGASTLGAGDVFHGALAWALARDHASGAPAAATPAAQVAFAVAVATLSTRSFGTRAWRTDPGLGALVEGYRAGR